MGVYDVFHISIIQKYNPDLDHVVEVDPLQLRDDLTHEERSIKIIDQKEQILRWRIIPYVEVQWSTHIEREAT